MVGDLATYLTTSVQIALAFPEPASGFSGARIKFTSIFACTQIPLAIIEGLLTVIFINLLTQYSRSEPVGSASSRRKPSEAHQRQHAAPDSETELLASFANHAVHVEPSCGRYLLDALP